MSAAPIHERAPPRSAVHGDDPPPICYVAVTPRGAGLAARPFAMKVFISQSHTDAALAARVSDALEK